MSKLQICQAFTTSSATTKPVMGRSVSQNLRAGMPCRLRLQRGGVATPAGTFTVYGAKLANPWANRVNTCLFKQRSDVNDANLTTADYQFLSNLAYAAFSNYNWFVNLQEFDQYVLQQGATVGFTISSGTGTKARVDFAAGSANGDGSTVAFTTALNYDSLAYCGLRVKIGSAVKVSGTDFTLSASATGLAVITFTVAPATGSGNITWQLYPKPGLSFGLQLAVPVSVMPYSTTPMSLDEIKSYDAMWAVTGSGVTGTIDCDMLPEGVGE